MKNTFTLTLFLVLASTIVANTSELDKFNNTKSTISFTENKGQGSDQNYNPRPDVLFSGVANGLTMDLIGYENHIQKLRDNGKLLMH